MNAYSQLDIMLESYIGMELNRRGGALLSLYIYIFISFKCSHMSKIEPFTSLLFSLSLLSCLGRLWNKFENQA
jgi:hypothetical protein